MPITREVGSSQRGSTYEVPDTELAIGSTLDLRSGDTLILFAGNTSEQTVNTSLRVGVPLSGAYRARVYESLLGEWADHGLLPADQLTRGHILKIERKGFSLVELRQEV